MRQYALWGILLQLVQEAIDHANWSALKTLLPLYDAVERAGPRSEMYESSYVAFLEDVRLPEDSAKLQEVWRHSPNCFKADLRRDRGLAKREGVGPGRRGKR